MLTKLLFRTLPAYYPANSAYVHFPFLVPSFIKNKMREADKSTVRTALYDWDRPQVPGKLVVVKDFKDVEAVVDNASKAFRSGNGERLARVMGGGGEPEPSARVEKVLDSQVHRCAEYFERTTRELLDANAYPTTGTRYINVVNDVINALPVKWICEELVSCPYFAG